MSEENKRLYRSFVDEIINAHNVDAMDDLIAEDFVDLSPPPAGFDVPPGLAGMKQMMGMLFGAFPDMHSTIEDLVAEGDKVVGYMTTTGTDKVVGYMTTTGTHTGDFIGIPATNRKVSFKEVHAVRIVNGKAVEHWGLSDDLGMMQQLGVIPTE